MARIVLITGGARSGKSAHAQKLAEASAGARTYIATCPRLDEEMDARIAKHRADREGRGWGTLEEPLDLAGALRGAEGEVILVDCLSLWVNNLMFDAEGRGQALTEGDAAARAAEVLCAACARPGLVVLVTNEVGLGIVPDNALARRYRDCLGRCNQTIAAGADTVVLVACGIPLVLKDGENA